MYCFRGIQLALKYGRISSYIQWSSLFWEGCPYLSFSHHLHLSSLLIIFVSHLMTCCRWSHDSWITSCPLITVYVNKPVSYANLNHGWLGETITTDEQQEEDQLDTCFSARPVSQTFTRTSCKNIWNDSVSPPLLPHSGWIIWSGNVHNLVFIYDCTQLIYNESQDSHIWK